MGDENEKAGGSSVAPEETESGPLTAESEVAQLRRRIEELEQKLESSRKQELYDRAELENFKRRMQRDKAESLRFATEPLVRDLLPVVDNLERALAHRSGTGESIADGVEMVVKMLLEVLSRHGISRVDAVGQRFDPAKHEALAQVQSDEHEANQVAEQHQVGYQLHDRLLRPALVSVSRGKSAAPVESPEHSD